MEGLQGCARGPPAAPARGTRSAQGGQRQRIQGSGSRDAGKSILGAEPRRWQVLGHSRSRARVTRDLMPRGDSDGRAAGARAMLCPPLRGSDRPWPRTAGSSADLQSWVERAHGRAVNLLAASSSPPPAAFGLSLRPWLLLAVPLGVFLVHPQCGPWVKASPT